MPKFAANLTMLWNEIDFLDRFAAAAKAGFSAVEYLFPYHAAEGSTARGEEARDALWVPRSMNAARLRRADSEELDAVDHFFGLKNFPD